MLLTIFTPSYNRAYRLNNLYQSLLQQNFHDFEWLIVDDGSIDETEKLVSNFQKENKIEINYYKQDNKGKHIAINKGVSLAKGDLFFIVDSDDRLPDNTLEVIHRKYETIKSNINLVGVAGRKAYFNKKIVGSEKPFNDLITDGLSIRFKNKIQGDLAEVFKTKILKQFPFPEIPNEKFCPEALVWNRIAQKYKLLYFNESIYECEYLEDGLTAKITKIRMRSPIASMLTYSELASYAIPFLGKAKATANYWRFSFHSKLSFLNKLKKVSLLISIIAFPLGCLMYLKDKTKN
ncbi:MAG: glycosyltransferase family 2 protein [Flavobacterium sp.]|nr:glycosyltransferase family 2 protein [Flavobacterium sp.]